MCLIVWGLRLAEALPWVVIANRDEFTARPTLPMHLWRHEGQRILAGRDLQAGGTWMAFGDQGRFAALTNVREPGAPVPLNAPSRGDLVLHAVSKGLDWAPECERYAGFNLIRGELTTEPRMQGLGHRAGISSAPVTWTTLSDGWHGVSNASLNTPWPKLERLKRLARETCERWLRQPLPKAEIELRHHYESLVRALLLTLLDQHCPADVELPQTGVGIEKERLLAPIHIVSPAYATRSSTVALMSQRGDLYVDEQSYKTPSSTLAPPALGELQRFVEKASWSRSAAQA